MTDPPPAQTNLHRLRWSCRRGMLELDYLFDSFLSHTYSKLHYDQQRQFERLLAYPDPLILAWIMGDERPQEDALMEIIDILRGTDKS